MLCVEKINLDMNRRVFCQDTHLGFEFFPLFGSPLLCIYDLRRSNYGSIRNNNGKMKFYLRLGHNELVNVSFELT